MHDDSSISHMFDQYVPTIRTAKLASRRLVAEVETYIVRHKQKWMDRHRFDQNAAGVEIEEKLLPFYMAQDKMREAAQLIEIGEHSLLEFEKN